MVERKGTPHMMTSNGPLVRATARVSVSKLAEYMTTADPSRRLEIVKNQRRPPGAIVPRYAPITDVIVRSLVDGDPAELRHLLPGWGTTYLPFKQRTEWTQRVVADQRDAGAAFLSVFDEVVRVAPRGVASVRNDVPKLSRAGVLVSVRPELAFEVASPSRRRRVGFGKLVLSKTHPLSREALTYAAVLVHQLACEVQGRDVDPGLCVVVDVFQGLVVACPASTKLRLRRIDVACHEIALLWRELARGSAA
jgi:hypothetical protein